MVHKYEDIISLENLLEAWEEFIRGKRGNYHVQRFARHLMDNIIALHEDLANKTYVHSSYRERHIWDPKHRIIHVAPVRDRLLHHAIYRILYPFFERTFIADSFSCRDNKGTHKALNRFRAMAYKVSRNHTRTAWVLKCDIKKFFASIDQQVLLELLASYIPGFDIMWLLGQVVKSFSTPSDCHSRGGHRHGGASGNPESWTPDQVGGDIGCGHDRRKIGLPLGNLTSQLFSNIYMNDFDRFVKHTLKAHDYIRYADDFILLHENNRWLTAQLPRVEHFLQERLHLQLHPKKVTIETFASGVDFLGWIHFPDHRVLRTATKQRMVRKLKLHATNETLQSYLGLLKHGNTFEVTAQLKMLHWLWTDDTIMP